MKNFLRKLTNIREGEGARVALMAGYLFVIISAYNILKPMTRSLFVSNLGLNQLPVLYIILALVVGVFVLLYMRIAADLRLNRLINATNLVLIVNLLLFWWLLNLEMHSRLLYYGIFIWASIFGVLTTTQFWLMANYMFNAREAKRLFPILTVFAILGGIAGGYVTNFFVDYIGGTNDLAFLGVGLLIASMILMNLSWQQRDRSIDAPRRVEQKQPSSLKVVPEVFSLIRGSRHLGFLIGIIFMTFVVVQIADFQFVAFASQNNTQTDQLTGFLGFWLSTMSVIALLFQIFFARSIIRRFGVGVTILFLPVALLVCSLGVFASYGLFTVLALKIGDGAFRHSINKVGLELLFIPISTEVKKKSKAFVDMFVDRFARGMAGVLLVIFYSWLGLTVAQISLLSVAVIGFWLFFSVCTYREYVNSFRQALASRRIDADELVNGSINDEETINSLIISLASRNERHVVYALRLLQSVKGVELAPPVLPLLQHKSPEVRYLSLVLLRQHCGMEAWPKIEPLLHDPSVQVRREAVRFFVSQAEKRVNETLTNWLDDQDPKLRGATLFHIAENPKLAKKYLNVQLIEAFVNDNEEARIQVADVLGILNGDEYRPFLMKLLEDKSVEVKLHAIQSAGQTKAPEFIPILLENLSDRNFRKAARAALANYGEELTGVLTSRLKDDHVPMRIRLEIPRVLSLMQNQKSVDVLLDNLDQNDQYLRLQVLKALNKLRTRCPGLNFDDRVDHALNQELKRYFRILAVLYVRENENGTEKVKTNLLQRVLYERLDDHIDRIFRLLGLRYPPGDIYNAYTATVSSNRSIRANAVEFLDNILSTNLKRVLIPIVEELPPEQVLQRANGLLDIEFRDQKEALQSLLEDSDPWIRACTIFEIGRIGLLDEFREAIEAARENGNSLVVETADLVLEGKRASLPAI